MKPVYLGNEHQIIEFRPMANDAVLMVVRTTDHVNRIYRVKRFTVTIARGRSRYESLRKAGYEPW